jgi:hypothetical protein
MFADPQSITVSGTTHALPRVPSNSPTRTGNFQNTDGTIVQNVHQNGSRNRARRDFRVTQRKVAADPLTAVNQEVSASVIFSFDEPKNGFSDTELIALFTGAVAQLQAGSNAKLIQLLGGEL